MSDEPKNKNFFDIWTLLRRVTIHGPRLQTAIARTFDNRNTRVPDGMPAAFEELFAIEKQAEWQAFQRRVVENSESRTNFKDIIIELRKFLLPVISALEENVEFKKT